MRNYVRLFAICIAAVAFVAEAADNHEFGVSIFDASDRHVHPEGTPFNIRVAVSLEPDQKAEFQWRDAFGAPLSEPKELPHNGEGVDVASPSGASGYYGLVILPSANLTLPNRQPGEPREYGFVILPKRDKPSAGKASYFGTVHAEPQDDNLPPWVKTLFWDTVPVKDWPGRMEQLRRNGKIELPIIANSEWVWDDSTPISTAQLDKIRERARAYFSADPYTTYWEAGIEENLGKAYSQTYYWDNLNAKVKALRKASVEAGVHVRLVYQVAARTSAQTKPFLESAVSREIDTLSMHPYAWPNFESPDTGWLKNFLLETKEIERANGRNLPIWFTEVGAPDFGNYEGGFFGYPELKRPTGGLSKIDMASFVAKTCVIGLANGVEKIFWYNYQDHGKERDHVEMHFGLMDYLGFPKPAYAAYIHLTRLLDGMVARTSRTADGLEVYEFSSPGRRVFVIWKKEGEAQVSASLLGLQSWNGAKVTDVVGHPQAVKDGSIALSTSPVFIEVPL